MATPVLGPQIVPSLLVKDLEATFSFYERVGFRRSGSFPEGGSPSWGEVTRDQVRLQFYTDPPIGTPAEPICSGTLYVATEGVAALAEEVQAADVLLEWGPEVMDYGMLEFAVRDPDGYLLAFTEPA